MPLNITLFMSPYSSKGGNEKNPTGMLFYITAWCSRSCFETSECFRYIWWKHDKAYQTYNAFSCIWKYKNSINEYKPMFNDSKLVVQKKEIIFLDYPKYKNYIEKDKNYCENDYTSNWNYKFKIKFLKLSNVTNFLNIFFQNVR